MVNIDTVYQKVLTIVNKEQRGYVTPQEFNLLADKAQLELINNYFHNMKTAYHKPLQNQTEGFDEMGMLEEKLGWLNRIDERSAVFENGGGFNRVIVYVPDDCYKIASVHLKGVGDRLYEHPWTISEADQIEEVEITQVSKSDLMLMNKNPLTKPTITRPVYVIYDTGHVWDGGNSYLELHPQVKMASVTYDNGLTGDELIETTMWQIANSTTTSDWYSPFYTTAGTVITGGIDQSANEGQDGVPTSDGFTTYGSTVVFDYYRKPESPKWGYVVINGKALYNSHTTVHFDLHPSEEESLVMRILELVGITIQKPQLQQAVIVDKQQTKQEQND